MKDNLIIHIGLGKAASSSMQAEIFPLISKNLGYHHISNKSSINNQTDFYFTHSFAVTTSNKNETWANSSYGKNKFASIIGKENIIGCQFHPEKSGKVGQNFIKNFLNI